MRRSDEVRTLFWIMAYLPWNSIEFHNRFSRGRSPLHFCLHLPWRYSSQVWCWTACHLFSKGSCWSLTLSSQPWTRKSNRFDTCWKIVCHFPRSIDPWTPACRAAQPTSAAQNQHWHLACDEWACVHVGLTSDWIFYDNFWTNMKKAFHQYGSSNGSSSWNPKRIFSHTTCTRMASLPIWDNLTLKLTVWTSMCLFNLALSRNFLPHEPKVHWN